MTTTTSSLSVLTDSFSMCPQPRMDQYFNQMEKIIKDKKTSSRIRFMLQDVLDLRRVRSILRSLFLSSSVTALHHAFSFIASSFRALSFSVFFSSCSDHLQKIGSSLQPPCNDLFTHPLLERLGAQERGTGPQDHRPDPQGR